MSDIIVSALSERDLSLQNEDAYCAEQAGPYFAIAIADGLTVHRGGVLASRTAIDSFLQTVKECRGSARGILMTAVRKADAAVRALEEKKVPRILIATTLVAAIIDDRNICTLIDVTGKNAFVITETTVQPAAEPAGPGIVPGLSTRTTDTGSVQYGGPRARRPVPAEKHRRYGVCARRRIPVSGI